MGVCVLIFKRILVAMDVFLVPLKVALIRKVDHWQSLSSS